MSHTKLHIGDSGWRAVYTDSFTLEKLSAIVLSLAEIYPKQKAFIGYDNRFLSQEFAKHAGFLLTQSGWQVDLVSEIFPTPGVACLVKNAYEWGLMITASHNPFYYNGLKILNSKGLLSERNLNDQLEQKALAKIENETLPPLFPIQFKPNFLFSKGSQLYLSQILKHVQLKYFKNSKLKVAWDSFAGTTTQLFPLFLKKFKLKQEFIEWIQEPTFGYRSLEPDANSLLPLKKLLLKKKCQIGIATDLDGDRFAVLNEKGQYILPNIIGPLLAWYLLEFRKERGNIYQTVSCSSLTQKICNDQDVELKEMPVGFQVMGREMQADTHSLLGIEETGGIAYAPHLCFKDGLMAHALLLEMLCSQKKKLSEMIYLMHQKYGRYHYHRVDLNLSSQEEKKQWLDLEAWEKVAGEKIQRVSTLDGQKLHFASGWLLIRDSKTEPLLRIYFESKNNKFIQKIKMRFPK